MTAGLPLARMQYLARDANAAGFSGLVVTEAGRTAYLGCAAAALAADIDILTGVAVAFPRSPMVTAQVAWELADATNGSFRLGLGTQVRAHIERRYGTELDHPGPRLREYVGAIRSAFSAFRGDPMRHEGEFWNLSILRTMWSPGPIAVPDPPIDLAAVNPWMLRLVLNDPLLQGCATDVSRAMTASPRCPKLMKARLRTPGCRPCSALNARGPTCRWK